MLENLPIINEIKTALTKAERILLISHQKPDGDALGALCSMAGYLKSLNKAYVVFCVDPVLPEYRFIPLTEEVVSDKKILQEKFDAVIVMDAGDLKYAGVQEEVSKDQGYLLINIDHHYTNDYFGHLNLVLPEKSSVSEIIFELFKLWQARITKEMATALLNGIVYDTNSLSNPATSYGALRAAASLISLGARFGEIKNSQLKNKSVDLLKVWGVAFQRLRLNQRYQIAYTVLTAADLAQYGLNAESSMGLVNFFNELAGVKAVILLTEQGDGLIKVSMRTTSDDYDLSRLAKLCGGGGHQKAAGFTARGCLVYNKTKWQIV